MRHDVLPEALLTHPQKKIHLKNITAHIKRLSLQGEAISYC